MSVPNSSKVRDLRQAHRRSKVSLWPMATATVVTICLLACLPGVAFVMAQVNAPAGQAKQDREGEKKAPAQKRAVSVPQRIIGRLAPGIQSTEQDTGPADPFAPPDRGKLRVLRLSIDAIKEERFSDALEGLTHLLEMEEDYFFRPDPAVTVFRSMKFEARSLLAGLPQEGYETYEQLYGHQAQRAVDTAVAAGDHLALQKVARSFPFTAAGNQATYLLALRAMDHGEFNTAAMMLQELTRSQVAVNQLEPGLTLNLAQCSAQVGDAERVEELTDDVATQFESSVWAWNGSKLPMLDIVTALRLPVVESSLRGFADAMWPIFGGDSHHNAMPLASLPLGNPTWRNAVVAAPKLRDALEAATGHVHDRGAPLVSSFSPLVVDDLVISRGLNNEIRAIDLNSGQLRWKTGFQVADVLAPPNDAQSIADGSTLEDRLWFDGVSGQLSTDGQRVFALEESWGIDAMPGVLSEVTWNVGAPKSVNGNPRNQLSAYDIATEGKLIWQIKHGDKRLGEHADVYFLGTPLIQGSKLLLLGETEQGEIRLYVLNAADGSLVYSQYILSNMQAGNKSPLRHTAGSMLAGHGTLVLCPTSAGALVAFDRASRQLLWGYSYKVKQPPTAARFRVLRLANQEPPEDVARDRWRICVPRIADDIVLVSPADSDELHCLRMSDGELLWTRPREDGLFVAGVQETQAIVVGKASVTAVALADGSDIWSCALPESKFPSGLGYFGQEHYFQPLASESVVAINLQSGEVQEKLFARRGAQPGNLVVTRDAILSQTPFGVERFPRLDIVARLNLDSRNELDAAALSTRAEVRLLEGNIEAAIADLEVSLELDPSSLAKELLLDAYLRGLREDTANFIQQRTRIEELVATRPQQTRFFLSLAQGLEKQGDAVGAYAAYLQVPRLRNEVSKPTGVAPVWPSELELIDSDVDVRMNSDAFIAWRLQELRDHTAQETEPKFQAIVQDLRKQIDEGTDQSASILGRLVYYLPHRDDAIADRFARLSLAEGSLLDLSAQARLKREVLLEEIALHGDQRWSGRATAQLGALYSSVKRWDLVQKIARRLSDDFADKVCHAELTGREFANQLLAKIPGDYPVIDPNSWPDSAMTAAQAEFGPLTGNEYSVKWQIAPGSILSGWNLRLAYQDHTLFGMDELGKKRFTCSLLPHLRNPQQMPIYYSHQAWSRGHLLIYSTGAQLIAIDTLSAGEDGEAEVLWSMELLTWGSQNRGFSYSSSSTDWGEYKHRINSPSGFAMGHAEFVSPEQLCVVRGGALLALDPFTGQRIWSRAKVDSSSAIFGDRRHIYYSQANANKAVVLDAATGVEVGERAISFDRNVMMGRDGKFLTWDIANQVTVSWQSPATEETHWETQVSRGSKASVLDREYLVIVEPDWKFQLIRISDGVTISSGTIPQEALAAGAQLQHVFAQRTADGIAVVAGQRATNTSDSKEYRNAISDGINTILMTGVVFGVSLASPESVEPGPASPQWSQPINGTTFLRTQPTAIPMVTFACRVYDRIENRTANQRTEILLLDTRNGETILQESYSGSTSVIRIDAAATRDAIRVRSTLVALEVSFAEEASSARAGATGN